MAITYAEVYHTQQEKKAKWGLGSWTAEPDKAVWVDPDTGLDCMIHRNRMGALCGYVGVPEGHPSYEVFYDDVQVAGDYPTVHGGLTYSGACQETDDPSDGLCHIPQDGRPDKVWWLGFDCAHAGDECPSMREYHSSIPHYGEWDTYKDFPYVIREVTNLASQLANVA